MAKDQGFERLIRLEDEELNESDDRANHSNKDSYKVLIENSDQLENGNMPSKDGHAKVQSTGISVTINGRHIHMNADQLRYLSLITLTVQNAALNLVMRATNTQTEKFSKAVAITVTEILKLITCIIFLCYQEDNAASAFKSIKLHIFDNYMDTLKVAVPSFVYYIQNTLLYVGSTHLDAATNQVIYQLKILTTALFSVFMLNKRLKTSQWSALVILFLGVAFIETTAVKSSKEHPDDRLEEPLTGFLAVLTASLLSGFAGVYFEKVLKSTSHISLWIRNIQLAAATIPIGLIQVFIMEHEHLTTKGMWYGFTSLTWLCIVFQAQGGLLVAVVVKFANNILKGFATSLAIVISTIASMFLFEFNLTPSFVLGSSMVIGSVMLYSK